MTYSSIHEYSERMDGYAKKLGYCAVIDRTLGSASSNPQFLVRLYYSGIVKTVDSNDIILYGNPSAGEPLAPPIPEDWLTEEDKNN